jgi:hypothetical protein
MSHHSSSESRKRRRRASPVNDGTVAADNEQAPVEQPQDDDDDGDVAADDEPVVDMSQYRVLKRVPHHAAPQRNHVFVSRRSRPMAQLAYVKALLLHPDARKRVDSVVIFGLGAAMQRAVELALRVAEAAPATSPIDVVATTGTTPLHDDYEPLAEGLPAFTRTRFNSFLRIELRRR